MIEIIKDYPLEVLDYLSNVFVFSGQEIDKNLKNVNYFKEQPRFQIYKEFARSLGKVKLKQMDYKDFIEEEQEADLLIVDPPYVHAYQNKYGEYTFSFTDYLECITVLMAKKKDFILFGVEEQGFDKILTLLKYKDIKNIEKIEKSMMRGSRKENAFLVQFIQ